jgi:thiamine-phosphate pyrophosphorylase
VRLPQPQLLVITDRHQARTPLEEVAHRLFAGGCRWLSLREKDMGGVDRLKMLRRLIELGRPWGATVTVHDDLPVAVAAGVGIHLPAQGSVGEARRALGDGALIGRSAHSAEEVKAAADAGADYVTLSPIFVSASKPGYGPALGTSALRLQSSIAVLALGGIGTDNVAACLEAGADGAAIMGGAMRAADPTRFMADLLVRIGTRPCP